MLSWLVVFPTKAEYIYVFPCIEFLCTYQKLFSSVILWRTQSHTCHHVNWTHVAAGSLRWPPATPWRPMHGAAPTWTFALTGALTTSVLRLAMEVSVSQ